MLLIFLVALFFYQKLKKLKYFNTYYIYINQTSITVIKLTIHFKMNSPCTIYISRVPCAIYISNVLKYHTEDSIRNYMHKHDYGDVDSVDFIVPNQRPGFIEPESHPYYKSAFVHFRNQRGNPIFWERILNGERYRISVIRYLPDGTQNYNPSGEWWNCSKAHRPVPRTIMNIHQVVANCRHLEQVVQTQTATIQQQTVTIQQHAETIQRLEQTVQGIHRVVHQLVGGLYSQHTQDFMIQLHLNELFPHRHPDPEPELTEQEKEQTPNIWPTTRQGDEHQHRITLLEKQIQILSQNILPPLNPIQEDIQPLLPPTTDESTTFVNHETL